MKPFGTNFTVVLFFGADSLFVVVVFAQALGLHSHGHGEESSHEGEDSHGDHHDDHSGPEFEDHTKKLLTLAGIQHN